MQTMLTIYFGGAISGGRADVGHYRRIVDALLADGHRVLAGAVASEEVTAHGEPLDPGAIFTRDLGWIEESDVLVAEGAGHTKRCSAMVAGDAGIELIEYDDAAEMLDRLRAALAKYTAESAGLRACQP